MSDSSRKSTRRRPGRLRRWLLRPIAWLVALVALLILGGWLVVRSPWVRVRLATELEQYLTRRLERQVTIGGLDFELLPLSVVVEDVAVADLDPELPPVGEARRIAVSADVLLAERNEVQLRRLEIDRPVLRIRLLEDGSHNLPRWHGAGEGERTVDVEIGVVELHDGHVELADRKLPLAFAARRVAARLLGTDGLDVEGRVAASEFRLQLPEAEAYVGRVEGRVRVARGVAQVVSARIGGPHLDAGARGEVRWGEQQRASFSFAANADGRLLDELGYLEEQIRGRIRFDGELLWRPESWGLRGTMTSERAQLFGWPLSGFEGVVSLDRGAALVDVERAGFGGGELVGRLAVNLALEERPAQLDLSLSGVELQELAGQLGIPVENLGGRVSGPFSYGFALLEPDRGTGWAQLEVAAGEAGRARIPFRGGVPVVIERGEVSIPGLQLVSTDHRLTASGRYSLARGGGRFEYHLEIDRVGSLGRLLPIETGPEPLLWWPTRARGTATGVIRLGPAATTVTIDLQLSNVEAPGIRARQLRGAMRIGETGVDALRLDLRQPDGALLITGSIPFEDTSTGPPFDLSLQAAGWEISQARPWLPFELPIEGSFTGSVRMGGRLESPQGRIEGEVRPLRIGEWSGGGLRGAIAFAPELVEIEEAVWSGPAGRLSAGGTIRGEEGRLDVELASDELELGRPPLDGALGGRLTGPLRLAATLSGTLAEPSASFSVLSPGLVPGSSPEQRLPLEVTGDWDGRHLSLRGHLGDWLMVEGEGGLTLEEADLVLAVTGAALGELVRVVAPEAADLSGSFEGEVRIRRALGGPWTANAVLPRARLLYGDFDLSAVEPVRLAWRGGEIEVESLYLSSDDGASDLFTAGTIGLAEPYALSLNVQSTLAADWLELALTDFDVEGRIDALATVRGTVTEPLISGQAAIADGRLVSAALPESLDEMEALVLFYPRQAVVDHLRGEIGGGDLRVSGAVQMTDLSYRFDVVGRNINVRYPQDWRLRGDAELVLASTQEGRELRGVVRLDRAFYLRDVRVGPVQLLQDFLRRQPIRYADVDETLSSTQLQVLVQGPEALRVRNNLANLSGSIDLTVRGSLARPVLFGSVETAAGGTLTYGGNEYRVVRGRLTFANPYRIEPYIDLVAETTIRQYDVTLDLSGSLERPVANFSSNPPLADLDVLSLLTTGQAETATLFAGAGDRQSGAAETFLYGQAATAVAQRVNTLFGLDKLQISPLTGASGNLSSARVTVGERLSKDVLATYSYDPTSTEVQILQVEWRVSQTLALLLTQNGDNSYAVDFRWEKQF